MTRSWRASGVRRGRLLAPLAVALTLGAAGLAAAELAAAPAAQAAVTTTFNHTGEQVYAVPAGVTAVTITAAGAPGGAGQYQGPGNPVGGGFPGDGALVTATVPLAPGTTTLYVEVGGPGEGGTGTGPTAGGFNGGGGSGLGGGGGGGASDVRYVSTSEAGSLASRLVVAGGGGGGSKGGNGGLGATTGGAGGTGGAGTLDEPCPGDNGSPGQGGDAPASCDPSDFGGGGGGGYYGGGGGGDGFFSGCGAGSLNSSGQATCSVAYSAPGSHSITAAYSGDAAFAPSASTTPLIQAVAAVGTTTAPGNATAAFSSAAQNVTLSASVSSTPTVNEGTVTFTVLDSSDAVVGTVTSGAVSGGVASVSYALPAGLPAGPYTIDASYADPAGGFGPSSATGTLTVDQPAKNPATVKVP